MHKLVFYPVGNGDTSQIILANGKRLLFDFRHVGESEDEVSPYIDLMIPGSDESFTISPRKYNAALCGKFGA